MSDLADFALVVQQEITAYGVTIQIIPFVAGTPDAVYRQGSRSYDTDNQVPVVGVVATDPSPEVLGPIGASGKHAGMVTLSRLDILAAYPLKTSIEECIRAEDDIIINGYRWRITSVHATGFIQGVPVVFVLVYDHLPGERGRTA